MSLTSVNTWKEVALNPSSCDRLKKNLNKIMTISDPTKTRNASSANEALQRDHQLVSVGVNSNNNKTFLIRHIFDLNGGIDSTFKAKVTLQGFNDKSIAL